MDAGPESLLDDVDRAVGNGYKLSASSTVIRDERYESNVCV